MNLLQKTIIGSSTYTYDYELSPNNEGFPTDFGGPCLNEPALLLNDPMFGTFAI